jgi:hypothetical protein
MKLSAMMITLVQQEKSACLRHCLRYGRKLPIVGLRSDGIIQSDTRQKSKQTKLFTILRSRENT